MDFSPSLRTIGVTAVLALASSLAFGLIPALQVSGGNGSRGRSRFRLVLVGTQIAACAVFLIVASLVLRSLQRVTTQYPGFEFDRVAVVDPALMRYGLKGAAARAYWERVVPVVRQNREVESVSLVAGAPLGTGENSIASTLHLG